MDAGTVRLVGTSRQGIYASAKQLLMEASEGSVLGKVHNPYGDGLAAERIRAFCLQYCNEAGNEE